MSEEYDVEAAIQELKKFAKNLDHEITDTIDDQQDGNHYRGFVVNVSNSDIVIYSTSQIPVFNCQFEYSVLPDYAVTMAENELSEMEGGTFEVPEAAKEEARTELTRRLEQLSDDEADQLQLKLTELVSNPLIGYNLENLDNHRVYGFIIKYSIFPYRDGFDIREYHEAVQTLLSTGVPARYFLRLAFGLRSGRPEGSGDQLDSLKDPTFQ